MENNWKLPLYVLSYGFLNHKSEIVSCVVMTELPIILTIDKCLFLVAWGSPKSISEAHIVKLIGEEFH